MRKRSLIGLAAMLSLAAGAAAQATEPTVRLAPNRHSPFPLARQPGKGKAQWKRERQGR